jgi:predicted dehydrogenase
MKIDRRLFLDHAALLGVTAGLLAHSRGTRAAEKPAKSDGTKADKLRVAVVGVKGRGMDHVSGFAARHNCEITHICDADSGVIGNAMNTIKERQGQAPTFVQDIRKLVENRDIDIISIATPNHWHALMAIWAMQNGKHVYVEKPVSHNVLEGRRIVEVARKTGKICQTGTQSRSSKGMRDAMEFLHSGKLGKVSLARGLCYKLRGSIGKVTGPQAPPKTVDYDLWCGPAPKAPLMRAKLHYDWHWVWDTGNGDLGNQGIHEMDKARWGLQKNAMPKSVVSIGGRFGYVDDGQTANSQVIHFDYGDCELVFEVRGLRSESPYPGKKSPKTVGPKDRYPNYVGNVWYGTEGYLVCPSYTGGIAYSKDGEILKEFSGGGDHYGNFVAAVRANDAKKLNAEIEEGHLSSALCHLGNISYRLGDSASLEGKPPFASAKANEAFESLVKHLKDSKIDLATTKYSNGKALKLEGEQFVGDAKANEMLTREYRKGFELPKA